MNSPAGRSGYESAVPAPERRAFFDLQRRITTIEQTLGIGGDGGGVATPLDEVWIGNDAPVVPESYELWYDPDATGDIPWINPTFLNGWSNFAAGYQNAQYRKIGDIVYLRGLIKGGTAPPIAVFNLPSGYRPPVNGALIFPSTISGGLHGEVRIHTDGEVRVQAGSTTYTSLAGLAFSVTA